MQATSKKVGSKLRQVEVNEVSEERIAFIVIVE
jgi:hypothetical protein